MRRLGAAVWTGFLLCCTSLSAVAAPCGPAVQSKFIVVDQFGYMPLMAKVAVVRSPVTGFDAKTPFAPGKTYQLVDATSCQVVFEAPLAAWKDGAEDKSSGDRTWSFDFSSVARTGRYLVRDKDKGEATGVFAISDNPYREVLVQAVRYFYFQRANIAKTAPYAGKWTDAADHMGPGQDGEARDIKHKNDPATARDLHGGWWDAGDFSRYTNWHSDYVISLLHSYSENPAVFTDDFNIPESGNGTPDLIDEVKVGMDWLVRMQNKDGGVLSILGEGYGSVPPSTLKTPAYYGEASASASYSAAGAFAYGAKVFGQFPQFKAYAKELEARAKKAWAWAETHPQATFFNKDYSNPDWVVGGGEQEVSPKDLPLRVVIAAVYLYDLTGEAKYQDKLDALVPQTNLIKTRWFGMSDGTWLQPLMYYAGLKTAKPALADAIKSAFLTGFQNGVYGPEKAMTNPYRAYLNTYYWGSNREEARQGFFFLNPSIDAVAGAPADAAAFAPEYLHYLHGVNPLGKVYLSNMSAFGAWNSVDEFYHAWFFKGTDWGNVKTSKIGPPPGYLVGGPNPSYDWEKGCPGVNPGCGSAPPSPPYGQPAQKSYADIGDGWPINSWSVTENSNGYQVEYIRLLTHFVKPPQK